MSIFSFFFVKPQKEFLDAHPKAPLWYNWLAWNVRNPFPGLNDMLGCKNKGPFTSVGSTVSNANPNGLTWNPSGGVNRITHTVIATGKTYSFVSYRGKKIETYFGTKPSGSFGIAFRKANAHGY